MNDNREESRQVQIAIIGLTATLVAFAVALDINRVRDWLGVTAYHAQFSDSGGLRPGDSVRVDGFDVGSVQEVALHRTTVSVTFRLDEAVRLGDLTKAMVRSDNALGRKYLNLDPSGPGNETLIPQQRTDPGYAVSEVLGDLTQNTAKLDTDRIAKAFDSMSTVLNESPDEFGAALDGVEKLSVTISSRDAELRNLLQRASSVSEVLASRNEDITDILQQGNLIFEELVKRKRDISLLIDNISLAAAQLEGFVKDNSATVPVALTELRRLSDLLARYRGDLSSAIQDLSGYARSLGEAVASGPFFQSMVANLTTPESIVLGDTTLPGKGAGRP